MELGFALAQCAQDHLIRDKTECICRLTLMSVWFNLHSQGAEETGVRVRHEAYVRAKHDVSVVNFLRSYLWQMIQTRFGLRV